MRLAISLVLVLLTALTACGGDASANVPGFRSCVEYVDGNVEGVQSLNDGQVTVVHFTNRSRSNFVGSYGLSIDTTTISRIMFHPPIGGGYGKIENVHFITKDSVGKFPPENLCKVSDPETTPATKQ